MFLELKSVACLVLLAAVVSASAKLPKPERTPVPATEQQKALLLEGVKLHDRGQYIKAIEQYQKVLAENSWEVGALHETAYSYFLAKDYEKSLETARLGAECKSPLLGAFHMMMGSALDELGRNAEALQVYKEAVKISPNDGLLRFNLAISLERAKRRDEAKTEIERALRLTPAHPSSQKLLGGFYKESGERIPAILAFTRFLITEPTGPRAAQLLPVLAGMLTGSVTKGKGPNDINIMIGTGGGKDGEGDFMGAEMMLSITVAAEFIEKPGGKDKQPKSQFDRLVSVYESLGESMQLVKPKGGFAAAYYAPYFAALSQAGHSAALVAYAFQSGNVAGMAEWEKENRAKLDAFLTWDRAYAWPAR
jgi:tetratricopeptide (TPR) repeat protein